MLFLSICGLVLIGSLLGSGWQFVRDGYLALKSQDDLRSIKGMIDGSEEFLAERYLRIRAEFLEQAECV